MTPYGKEIRMKLSVVDCPHKTKFRPYVRRATKFYAQKLFTEKMLKNINLKITFVENLEDYGSASVDNRNDSGKPREFTIEINKRMTAVDILKTLAHEMVHIKQYAYCDLNEYLTRWKGTRISDDLDYYDHPWEIEAHGMETGLFVKFAKKERLWEIFEGMPNPFQDIKPQRLGWKKKVSA